jgi:hypothetical protein
VEVNGEAQVYLIYLLFLGRTCSGGLLCLETSEYSWNDCTLCKL